MAAQVKAFYCVDCWMRLVGRLPRVLTSTPSESLQICCQGQAKLVRWDSSRSSISHATIRLDCDDIMTLSRCGSVSLCHSEKDTSFIWLACSVCANSHCWHGLPPGAEVQSKQEMEPKKPGSSENLQSQRKDSWSSRPFYLTVAL